MDPEVTGGRDRPIRESSDINDELESFWKLSKVVAEKSRDLERPFQQELEKNRLLERRLVSEREDVRRSQLELRAARERIENLEAEIKAQQQEERDNLRHTSVLEQERASLLKSREHAESELRRERAARVALEERLHESQKQAQGELQAAQARSAELSAALEKYHADRNALVAHDLKMREIVAQVQAALILEKKKASVLGQTLRKGEDELARDRSLLKTTQAALMEARTAVARYQEGWSDFLENDRKLREIIEGQKVMAMEYVREREALLREKTDVLQENANLRREKAVLEENLRQSGEALASMKDLTGEMAAARALLGETRKGLDEIQQQARQEAEHFRVRAEQDEVTKQALLEELDKAERLYQDAQAELERRPAPDQRSFLLKP